MMQYNPFMKSAGVCWSVKILCCITTFTRTLDHDFNMSGFTIECQTKQSRSSQGYLS